MDATAVMDPRVRTSPAWAACASSHTARVFREKVRSHCATGRSTSRPGPDAPALQTSMCRSPAARSAWATMSAHCSGTVRSPTTPLAWAPWARRSSSKASSRSPAWVDAALMWMPTLSRRACAMRAMQMPRPIPPAAPVTSACLVGNAVAIVHTSQLSEPSLGATTSTTPGSTPPWPPPRPPGWCAAARAARRPARPRPHRRQWSAAALRRAVAPWEPAGGSQR